MKEKLSEIERFLNKTLEFYSLKGCTVELEMEDKLLGGGVVANFRLWYNYEEDSTEKVLVPVMIRDEDNIYRAFGKKFISPISMLLIKKEDSYVNLDGESITTEEGELDFTKISVVPLYYIYLASKISYYVSRFLKEFNENFFNFFVERTFTSTFGREVSVFTSSGLYDDDDDENDDSNKDEKKKKKKRESNTPRIILRGKIFEDISNIENTVEHEFMKRKFIIPSGKTSEKWRYFNATMIGRVDPFETPESEKIGLVLSLVDQSVYDPEKFKLMKTNKLLSTSTLQIPFILHSDGTRISMGAKNLKQALKVEGSQQPLVKTKDNILDCGVNALVVYTPFYGFTFEDGIVVSKSFARSMKANVQRTKKILIKAPAYSKNLPNIDGQFKEKEKIYTFLWEYSKKKTSGIYHIETKIIFFMEDSFKKPEDPIGKVEFYINKEKADESNIYAGVDYKFKLKSVKLISVFPMNKKYTKNSLLQISTYTFQIELVEEKPLQIGDKLTGRHGNKGIVSLILDDKDMPKVKINGKEISADVIISPLSVVSRMNLSQLYETQVSIALKEGKWPDSFDPFYTFDKKKRKQLLEILKSIGSDDYGRFEVEIPPLKKFFPNSKSSKNYLVAGYQYILRLDHNVKDKFHAIGTPSKGFIENSIERELKTNFKKIKKYVWQVGNPEYAFNVFTLQPPKGKQRAGGQKMGEMEFWTLLDHGAYSILEKFNERNFDDFSDILEKFNVNYLDFINYALSAHYRKEKKYPHISSNGAKTIVELKEYSKEFHTLKIWKDFINDYRNRRLFNKLTKKDGYIRKIIISRRLYNSARAVIVPRPDIRVDEIVLPHRLKDLWEAKIGDIVIVNRQPSLHRNSIQAFRIKEFWNEYAVGFPILVCKGFNADFDGDTVALYYIKNQQDEKIKSELENMLPTNIPFLQGSGEISMSIDQDIVCGAMKEKSKALEEIASMVKQRNFDDMHNLIKEHIISATESGLTLSIYEIEKDKENFEKIKKYKCRGNKEQWNQLNMEIDKDKPKGYNFLNGVERNVYIEYIARRSRRSLLDKKLHVAKAGYFTRKLVEIAGDVKIQENCQPDVIVYDKAFVDELKRLVKEERIKDILYSAMVDRYTKDLYLVEKFDIDRLIEGKIGKIEVLSPVGGCTKIQALGLDPATGKNWRTIHVGVLAGHTIGERGTQLSMKTFHTGGSGKPFNMDKIENYIYRVIEESFTEGKSPSETFKEFILKMAKINDKEIKEMIGKENLLEFFNMRLVYFEILYYAYTRILKEGIKRKEWLSSYKERGVLTTISFESGKSVIENLTKEEYIESSESHPRVRYFFGKGAENIIQGE